MPTRFAILMMLFPAFVPVAARGQTILRPSDRESLELTVYSSGFAQVTDVRRSGAAGGNIVWAGVPGSIDPGTILLTSDGRAIDFRLHAAAGPLDSGPSILSRHVGDSVRLVSPDRVLQGIVVSPYEPAVYRVGDDLILDWQGHVEIPLGGMVATGGKLRFEIESDVGDDLGVSYLADALDWAADYVAVLQDDASGIRMSGRLTVDNRTDFAFRDADLRVVAGEVRRLEGGPPMPYMAESVMRTESADMGGDVERAPLGDYHIYVVDEPITVGAFETVQVPLFGPQSIPVEREYILTGQRYWFHGPFPEPPGPENPFIRLTFVNQDLAGDDEPLPAGTLHTYVEGPGGDLQFTGDASIPHTAAGERIEAVIGTAFDLVAERTQTDYQRIDENTHESAWRIEVRNRGSQDRTVTILEPLIGDWVILEESHPHERIDAGTVRWDLSVPAGGEAILTYRVRATTR